MIITPNQPRALRGYSDRVRDLGETDEVNARLAMGYAQTAGYAIRAVALSISTNYTWVQQEFEKAIAFMVKAYGVTASDAAAMLERTSLLPYFPGVLTPLQFTKWLKAQYPGFSLKADAKPTLAHMDWYFYCREGPDGVNTKRLRAIDFPRHRPCADEAGDAASIFLSTVFTGGLLNAVIVDNLKYKYFSTYQRGMIPMDKEAPTVLDIPWYLEGWVNKAISDGSNVVPDCNLWLGSFPCAQLVQIWAGKGNDASSTLLSVVGVVSSFISMNTTAIAVAMVAYVIKSIANYIELKNQSEEIRRKLDEARDKLRTAIIEEAKKQGKNPYLISESEVLAGATDAPRKAAPPKPASSTTLGAGAALLYLLLR